MSATTIAPRDFDCCLNGGHVGDPAIQHDGARQAETDAALRSLEQVDA